MLDKNERGFEDDLVHVRQEFNKNSNVVFCSEPFLKVEFLNELIHSVTYPVIFLDFDLLYSGYVVSQIIQKNDRVEIYRPNKLIWEEILTETIKKISNEKFLVIVDSINGLYNMFDKKESGRSINASLMLLASVGERAGSSVIIIAMARKNDKNEWILSPGGRHVIVSKKSGIYNLKKSCDGLMLSSLNQDEIRKKFKISHSDV
jgi:hypothetical protein